MKKRHPHNPNLTLIEGPEWNGLKLLSKHSPYIEQYLERILETMRRSVDRYRRTTALRIDLRIPVESMTPDSDVMSRFFGSLQAKINAHQLRKARLEQRVHSCELRYIWVREKNTAHHRHYHCCLFLNGDAYRHLGSFITQKEQESTRNMANRIRSAWASALGCSWEESQGLVNYTKKGIYRVDANDPSLWDSYSGVFKRLSYFAKTKTKHFGGGKNNFGCSRR